MWSKFTNVTPALEILQNLQEKTCVRVSFLIKIQARACNFIEKETLAQVFSCEFCKSSKNTFFTEQLRVTASVTINTSNCAILANILPVHFTSLYDGDYLQKYLSSFRS